MVDNSRVQQAIYDAIDELNQQSPVEMQLPKAPGTVLFGREGKLDSLGLVTLIVGIEGKIRDTFGVAVTIADEKAFSQKNSPFRTIDTLSDYISGLIKEG
jgi:D-alanine--poly(phosphoribitol) ligase subunit 2